MDTLPEPTTASSPSRPLWRRTRGFLREWFQYHWVDVIWLAIVGAACLTLHYIPIPITRTFPITFNESGDIVYPDLAYPPRGWIISTWVSGVTTLILPILVYILAQIRIKSAWDANSAIVGTIWAVALATLFQVVTKTFVGGFRPYFLEACMPDISLAADPKHNTTGLNGVGYHQVMYTTEICTQTDAKLLRDSISSFPSGHSAAGFAGFGFLFLWLNSKLKVWADYRPVFWKLLLTMLPLLGAWLNACILTVDGAHHSYDILAGSFIGIVMAVVAYRTTYAAVWDWRYNHLPLLGREAFVYGAEDNLDYTRKTLTRKVGWGGKKDWLHDEGDDGANGRTTSAEHAASSLGRGIGGDPLSRR